MDEPEALSLTPFEARLLQEIGRLYLEGVKSDPAFLIAIVQYLGPDDQTLGEALGRLRENGLVKKTLTGKYRPTRLGMACIELEQRRR